MGEIAEDIISGVYCQVCGEYIGEGHGRPRTCRECKNSLEDDEVLDDEEIDEEDLDEYDGEDEYDDLEDE